MCARSRDVSSCTDIPYTCVQVVSALVTSVHMSGSLHVNWCVYVNPYMYNYVYEHLCILISLWVYTWGGVLKARCLGGISLIVRMIMNKTNLSTFTVLSISFLAHTRTHTHTQTTLNYCVPGLVTTLYVSGTQTRESLSLSFVLHAILLRSSSGSEKRWPYFNPARTRCLECGTSERAA